jgi:hypothetical protein
MSRRNPLNRLRDAVHVLIGLAWFFCRSFVQLVRWALADRAIGSVLVMCSVRFHCTVSGVTKRFVLLSLVSLPGYELVGHEGSTYAVHHCTTVLMISNSCRFQTEFFRWKFVCVDFTNIKWMLTTRNDNVFCLFSFSPFFTFLLSSTSPHSLYLLLLITYIPFCFFIFSILIFFLLHILSCAFSYSSPSYDYSC